MVIDGKRIAEGILEKLKARPPVGRFFGAALVGDDPASVNFLKQKEKVGKELGIDFRLYPLPADISTDELRAEIGRLAQPKNCGGFIVQLPLPEGINKHYALNAIPKEKDVDLLSEAALGAFYSGRSQIVPPSVAVVEEILNMEHRDLRGLKVAMVGAGFLIGKPVGFWLQNRVGELAVLDSKVKDLWVRLHDADIVISGAGRPKLFSAKHLKEGAMVIDFGFNRLDGKIAGDFDPSTTSTHSTSAQGGEQGRTTDSGQASSGQVPDVEEKNITYTKTPGGTGPILVAKLFENFYRLNGVY